MELPPIARKIGAIALIGLVSEFAFSGNKKKQIRRRDDNASVWSGKTADDGYRLECSHITHDKNDPRYNEAGNGRLLTREEHYWDHVNRAGRNGLTEDGNNWAVNKLYNTMTEEEQNRLNNMKLEP